MKRFFVILLSISILAFVLSIPSFADSSVSVIGYNNILSWSLSDDSDDGVESLDVQFSAFGSNSWSVLDSYSGNDLLSVSSYIIPDSLMSQGNRFRVSITTANATRYSNIYTVTQRFFDNYRLDYDFDTGYFSFTVSPSATVLHFDYLGTSVNPDFIQAPITLPAYSNSYFYLYGVHIIVFPNGNQQTYISVPLHDCLVYATTVIDGVTYTSNTIRLYGSTHSVAPPVDTEVYSPPVADVDNMVELIYGGVTHTPVYKYCMSAVLLCLPVIAGAFVVKKFVL